MPFWEGELHYTQKVTGVALYHLACAAYDVYGTVCVISFLVPDRSHMHWDPTYVCSPFCHHGYIIRFVKPIAVVLESAMRLEFLRPAVPTHAFKRLAQNICSNICMRPWIRRFNANTLVVIFWYLHRLADSTYENIRFEHTFETINCVLCLMC